MTDRDATARGDEKASRWRVFWSVVERIPEGRVATYGQVASLAGHPRHARQVGYALHALPEKSEVPWQRVVNARGEVSRRSEPGREGLQQAILESEGVEFDDRGRIDLERWRWNPSDEELDILLEDVDDDVE